MATKVRQDDARRTGDALDRVIDEAVESALRARPVDLRSRVLARLEEVQAADDARTPRGWLWRPALLPAVGALLLVAGVGLLWQHANDQLNAPRVRSVAGTQARATPTGSGTRESGPPASAPPETLKRAAELTPSPTRRPGKARATPVTTIAAASLLEMDAASAQGKGVGASVVQGDAELDEPYLPGAPTGNAGDPIAPMPQLRPIVIPPIATPPITEAPPVSTLGKPVSTLSDEVSRDRQDPGKSGGMIP